MTRKEENAELIYKEESYAIIGACFEVYKNKGCGSTNRSTTNAWRSSLNSREFHSYQTTGKFAVSQSHAGSRPAANWVCFSTFVITKTGIRPPPAPKPRTRRSPPVQSSVSFRRLSRPTK